MYAKLSSKLSLYWNYKTIAVQKMHASYVYMLKRNGYPFKGKNYEMEIFASFLIGAYNKFISEQGLSL